MNKFIAYFGGYIRCTFIFLFDYPFNILYMAGALYKMIKDKHFINIRLFLVTYDRLFEERINLYYELLRQDEIEQDRYREEFYNI